MSVVRQRKHTRDRGVEGVTRLAVTLHEPLVNSAVAVLRHYDEATKSVWGAACFMRVLSHFIWVEVWPSRAFTVS